MEINYKKSLMGAARKIEVVVVKCALNAAANFVFPKKK